MGKKEIQKNSGINSCFSIIEFKQSRTYEIRLAYPSDAKNVVLLNQLFSYLHRHGILAIRKTAEKEYYISIPLERDNFDEDLTFEGVEYAINDFAVQQRRVFGTENGLIKDFLWCIHCNKGFKNDFLLGDIYNNEYSLLCDVCNLEDEEKVEEEVDRRIKYEELERDEEEMERNEDDEEWKLESEDDTN